MASICAMAWLSETPLGLITLGALSSPVSPWTVIAAFAVGVTAGLWLARASGPTEGRGPF